ncbi:MAG: extracellular solute-binding protein [Pseudomonadota bacterium]
MSRFFLSLLFSLSIIAAAHAQEKAPPENYSAPDAQGWRHALSLMGQIRHPKDFKHFDYVNPDAPKGGRVRLATESVFDSFNIVLPKGVPAPGLGTLIYLQLMEPSLDEVSTEYGSIADKVKYPDDFSSVTYHLRSEAKWEDGTQITPEDVIWSFQNVTKLNPTYAFYYANVSKVEKTAEHEVTFTFDKPGNREKPNIIGQLVVLPMHWWEGKDAKGNKRDITQNTLEAPIGSGPYRVKSFDAGRSITYERVKDWWAKDLPVNVGRFNFDEIHFDAYRDDTVQLEAFKSDQFDFRLEISAKNWATAYNFPALQQGKVIKEAFPMNDRGTMQAFVFNLRRERFADARVRRAFNYAFDFEDMNQALFYGQYERINSFFYGTELTSKDLPKGKELEILESVKDDVPKEVFTETYTNPKGGNPKLARENLREAARLFKEAGWDVKNGKLVNTKGETFRVEFLIHTPAMERVILPYKNILDKLGLEVGVRTVDPSQYIERMRNRDFDVTVSGWGQSLSPGNEQREFWGTEAADREGSQNYGGIKNKAVDTLIDRVIFAKDRDELVAATKALDRVLLMNNYVVPQYTAPVYRTARWDRFGRPAKLPSYSYAFPDIWWFDAEKAKKTGAQR